MKSITRLGYPTTWKIITVRDEAPAKLISTPRHAAAVVVIPENLAHHMTERAVNGQSRCQSFVVVM